MRMPSRLAPPPLRQHLSDGLRADVAIEVTQKALFLFGGEHPAERRLASRQTVAASNAKI